MKSKVFASLGVMIIAIWSCSHDSKHSQSAKNDTIIQQDDGTLALNLDKAALYSDLKNPSDNTAEWNFKVSKPGRYKVWLSSATLDTTNLKYSNPVRFSFLDKLIEINPACDKVVRNSSEVSYPYFRADSYLGSFYISDPGQYNIQVISDKIRGKELSNQISQAQADTRIMSVILTPATR